MLMKTRTNFGSQLQTFSNGILFPLVVINIFLSIFRYSMHIWVLRENTWICMCGDGRFRYMSKIGKHDAIMFCKDYLYFKAATHT